MRLNSAIAIAGTIALGALPLAGCGDDDGKGGGPYGGGGTQSAGAGKDGGTATTGGGVTITETEFALDPANPTVAPGQVTFEAVNDGETEHALEVEGPSGEKETHPIAPGGSATLSIDLSRPGNYKMYCPVANHEQLGMVGKVRVKG